MFATTIVLIHGAWLSAASWKPWCDRYEARGYDCVAPAWPNLGGNPAQLRAHPPAALDVESLQDVVDHYAAIIRKMPDPPILVGHSFGGLVVLKLLDEGLGRAGVALEPAPPKGVPVTGSGIKAAWPVIRTWKGGQKSNLIDFERWVWAFGSAVPSDQQHAVYDRYVIPVPGRPFFEVFWAAFTRHTKVDFHKAARPPLLLVAGQRDRVIPKKVVEHTWKHYEGGQATTVLQEFDHTHGIVIEPGWQDVADFVISWVEVQTGLTPHPKPPHAATAPATAKTAPTPAPGPATPPAPITTPAPTTTPAK